MPSVEFDQLFVFDLANNHMGSVEHGLRIIRELREAVDGFDFRFAVKLQVRHLDTFIHPDYRERHDFKYVKRFLATRLAEGDLRALREEAARCGFLSACTPFDEPSVDLLEAHGHDLLKVASCSMTDWPLLERMARTDRPILVSTGGATLDDIDNVVSFLTHRDRRFCLLHCVAEYPTPREHQQLGQIDLLRRRYRAVPIGLSTHEDPEDMQAIGLAIAKGAVVFEKHVGVPTDAWPLNAYSATPAQVRRWLVAAREAFERCGESRLRVTSERETAELRSLQRGTWARRALRAGERLDRASVLYAIPTLPGHLVANDWSKYSELTAAHDIREGAPILAEDVTARHLRADVAAIVARLRGLLVESRVALPNRVELELSHHYGLDRFAECGATIANVVNREYCKKLIILLPGQRHPTHLHRIKEETFHLLHGELRLTLGGVERRLRVGDLVTVDRGMPHSFSSAGGAIIEEISTQHHVGDSYYDDASIEKAGDRKTNLTYWSDWLDAPPDDGGR